MSQRTVVLDLAGAHQLARDLVAAGVFVPELVELGEHCTLVLKNGAAKLELHARCVYVDASRGSGLQLVDCDQDMKHRIMALASGMFGASAPGFESEFESAPDSESEFESAPDSEFEFESAPESESAVEPEPEPEPESESAFESESAVEPEPEPDLELLTLEPEPQLAHYGELINGERADGEPTDGEPTEGEPTDSEPVGSDSDTDTETDEQRKIALNVSERLRGLTVVQQLKVAAKGELSERIVLERLYGKSVWEALLRNPRITGHEVARIARMGALPRPLIELIVGNGAWLQVPEVRRALLTNPRLASDQIVRVLRLLPKHELKLAGVQTAYPFAVRDAAKRILREQAG